MRLLRASDHRRMPWKNGGGMTVEIAVSPEGAGIDDFDWRVSMAFVEQDGPFSVFPGVDRTLAVLSGDGILLRIAGQGDVTLSVDSEPLSFPADVPTAASLVGGPIADLNVMTRRGRASHRMRRLAVEEPMELVTGGPALLFCAAGACAVSTVGELAVHDALIMASGERVLVRPVGANALVFLTEVAFGTHISAS